MVILFTIISCKKDKNSSNTEFNISLQKFYQFKNQSNNSYIYTVVTASWTGYSTTTKITVENGIVSAREFQSSVIGPNPIKTVIATWVEGKESLKTHQEGAETLTLDQVYQKAKREWINVNQSKNQIYFEAKNNGMISNCGYVPNGCADDCFTGITISEIKAL